MDFDVTIDGSQGEGGGQILRSSMALAVVTGKTLQIRNIRAGRSKPGLMRQHLTSVCAAAEICGGELQGAELGSSEVQFVPGAVRSGEYQFRVGSAGSAMLVLQTVLPPLLTADGPSVLVLEGGTHNQWAPPFDFLVQAYLPFVNRMGPHVTARLEQHGFYPAGGGRVVVEIQPSSHLAGFDVVEPGRVLRRQVTALVSQLPQHIGEREVRRTLRKLNWRQEEGCVEAVRSSGPGNVLFAEIECENVTEVFTAFGRQGVRAEKVSDGLVREIQQWISCGALVGEYLADQLLLPLGLSAAQCVENGVKRGGRFCTGPLSQHSVTHIDVLRRFLDIDVQVTQQDGVVVEVSPGD